MRRKLYRNTIISLIIVVLLIDIIINGVFVIKERIKVFNQYNDVAFEIGKWWRLNISKEAIVVADHPTRVYIPTEYKKVIFLRSYEATCSKISVIEQFRQLVNDYQPKYIYYNVGKQGMPKDSEPWPPINEILPDKRVKLVKTFESAGRSYQRHPDDKFVICEVCNNEEW